MLPWKKICSVASGWHVSVSKLLSIAVAQPIYIYAVDGCFMQWMDALIFVDLSGVGAPRR